MGIFSYAENAIRPRVRVIKMSHVDALAFIFPCDTFGGHEIMSLKMIRVLQERKTEVHCYVSRRNKRLIDKLREANATLHLTSFFNSKLDLLLGFLNPWILANIYQLRSVRGGYNHLVLVNGNAVANHGTTLAVAFYSRACGIRSSMYIPMLHTSTELGLNIAKATFYEASVKRALKFMSDIWTIDQVWSDRAIRINNEIKCHVIRNLVEPTCLDQKQEPRSSGNVELCFVGRVEKRQKGLDYLVELLERIRLSTEITMHIVGDGPDLDWLKNEVSNRTLESRIRFSFHGWVSSPLSIVSDSDALIMTSRVEGVPLVAIEALMVGTPVFAFAIPGVKELLGEEFVATPFLVEELSDKLNEFLIRPRGALGRNQHLTDLMDMHRFERELNRAIASA